MVLRYELVLLEAMEDRRNTANRRLRNIAVYARLAELPRFFLVHPDKTCLRQEYGYLISPRLVPPSSRAGGGIRRRANDICWTTE